MASIPLENVAASGIIQDIPSHELPPEAWSDGRNVRFVDNKVMKMQGSHSIYQTPTVAPHGIFAWQTINGYRWIYAGLTDMAYTDGNAETIITRYTTTLGDDDYSTTARPIWTGGILHGVPILNHDNGTDFPQQWNGADRMKDLDNWPANTYCKFIRTYKNYLIAGDITVSAVRDPYLIMWSDAAAPGTIPTSWDHTVKTNLAGRNPISETKGILVDTLPLGDANIIYKEDSIVTMNLVQGVKVFSFRGVSNYIGALAPRCIVELARHHFIVGADDIVIFDGVSPVTLVDRKMRKWFYDNLSPEYAKYTFVVPDYKKKEMNIFFVQKDTNTSYVNMVLIWSWQNKTWTIQEVFGIAHAAYGPRPTLGRTYDGASGTFEEISAGVPRTEPFDAGTVSSLQQELLLGKVETSLTLLRGNSGYTSEEGDYTSYVERKGLAIAGVDRQGNVKLDNTVRKFVRAFLPKIAAESSVNLTIKIGGQETYDGTVTWITTDTFDPTTDFEFDCEVNTPFIAIRIEDTDSVLWEYTGSKLEMEVLGR